MKIKSFVALVLVLAATPFVHAQGLSVKQGKGVLEFYDGDKLITKFHHEGYSKPIFFPVNAPCGVPLTRSWPMKKDAPGESTDHPWQKSSWFCHGDVVAEGLTLKNPRKGVAGTDFWADGLNGCGTIACKSVEIKQNDRDHIVVVAKIEWLSPEGEKLLDETRVIHVYKLHDAWLIVSESDLSAPTWNIVFDDTKEGSFGIRINDQIVGKTKGKIQNAEGKLGEKECWGHPSAWCDYSGPIDGKSAGITILCDPKNPHPSCFHVRDYGLMAANPFGRNASGFPAMKGRTDIVRLEKGGLLKLRYGLLLHDGDAAVGRVAENFERFAALKGKD